MNGAMGRKVVRACSMSHEAVRAFYREIAAHPGRQHSYKRLTWGFWLGYNPEKIVEYARLPGHEFTVEELEFVRLTNYGHKPAMMLFERYRDEQDYEPTAHPHPPASAEKFRATHGRAVDGADRDFEKAP